MALQFVTLERVADAFSVHPRTILRAVEGKHNTYWYEDSNEEVWPIETIADAYKMETYALVAVIEGRDKLIRADEAAKEMSMAARTFRKRLNRSGVPSRWGRIKHGNIVRYLQSKIIAAAIDGTEE